MMKYTSSTSLEALGTTITAFQGMFTKIDNDVSYNCRLTAVLQILGVGTVADSFEIDLPLKNNAITDPYSLVLTVNQDMTSGKTLGVSIFPSPNSPFNKVQISVTSTDGNVINTFLMYLSAHYKV